MGIQLATKRVFLTFLIVSIAASAVLGTAAIVSSRSWFMQEELIGTAVLTGLYSLAALGASIPFDRGHWRFISGGAIVVIIIGLGLTVLSLWIPQLQRSDGFTRFVGVVATIGGISAHASLISMARVSRSYRWVQLFTLVLGLFLATAIIGLIIVDPSYPDSQSWETFIWLCVVLMVCGSIVVPIAHVLNRVETAERVETLELEMTIVCPRCRLKQDVNSGHSTCPQCKLRFKIEIEEPRCDKCGYLLYQLTENRCPECGESFEQELVASDAGDEVSGT